jgi:hypothetical protein
MTLSRIKLNINESCISILNFPLISTGRSPSVVRIVKYRRVQLAGHVARMRETRDAYII